MKKIGNIMINTIGLMVIACSIWACDTSTSNHKSLFAGYFAAGIDMEEADFALSQELSDSLKLVMNLETLDLNENLRQAFKDFYQLQNYNTAWVKEIGINNKAEQLMKALARAEEDGLNSDDYKLTYLQHLSEKVAKDKATNEAIKLDKELTAAYLKFASHKLQGRVNPERLDALWRADPREKDLAVHLHEAVQQGEILKSLKELEPKDPQYAALKKAYVKYKQLLKDKGEWPKLPGDLLIEAGDSSKYVATLRERLAADGYFKYPKPDSLVQIYDSTMVKAIMLYQAKNSIASDGIVGGETLHMLNTSLQHRLNQIQLNLERMRWSAQRPEGRYLLVNVPQYMLYVYEGDEKVMDMKVIVGEAYESNTPLFNDTVEYISFSPTWTVPVSIATQEILPILRKNPGYLRNNHFKLYRGWSQDAPELNPYNINWHQVSASNFPYRIVQQPGDHNALGHVKFMFPNDLKIYLHDTPAEHLFDKAERDFSHGCIRVERPVDLAYYLLEDPQWNKEQIKEYMHLDEPENVRLENQVPVIIDYRTAWVDEEGHIVFAKDLYGHDEKQLRRFNELVAAQ